MKIYTKEEAQALWEEDQVLYAEAAHHYPCCNLPQESKCVFCDDGIYCDKIKGFTPEREE